MSQLQIAAAIEGNSRDWEVFRATCEVQKLKAERFHSLPEYLDSPDGMQPGCVVADFDVCRQSGYDIDGMLLALQRASVVVTSTNPTTALAVRAMKAGAVTVVDKPYVPSLLRDAIKEAMAVAAARLQASRALSDLNRRQDSLTDKERKVLELIVVGKPNKAMAEMLDVSLRTIENRRRAVFAKFGVGSVAELVTAKLRLDGSVPSTRAPQSPLVPAPKIAGINQTKAPAQLRMAACW